MKLEEKVEIVNKNGDVLKSFPREDLDEAISEFAKPNPNHVLLRLSWSGSRDIARRQVGKDGNAYGEPFFCHDTDG